MEKRQVIYVTPPQPNGGTFQILYVRICPSRFIGTSTEFSSQGPKSPLKLPFPDAKSSQGPEDLLGSRKMMDKIRGKTMVVRHHMEGLRRQSRNEEETYEDSEVEAELSNIFSK